MMPGHPGTGFGMNPTVFRAHRFFEIFASRFRQEKAAVKRIFRIRMRFV